MVPANGAPGITEDTATMGVVTVRGFDTVVNTFDLQGVELGDTKGQAEAMIAVINERGGVGGRQLQAIYHEVDITQDTNTSAQAICEDFAHDRPVFMVLNIIWPADPDLLYGCLQEAGIPSLDGSSGLGDANFYGRYAQTLYGFGAMNLTRTMRSTIAHLNRRGWFGDAPVIGVIAYDNQEDRDVVAQGIESQLAAEGLPAPVSIRYVTTDTSGPGMYQNAVLEFRSLGVTHVLFTWTSVFLWGQAAESQSYRPLIGVHTSLLPQFLQDNVPDAQLSGAAGIGFQPETDLDEHHLDALPPRRDECRQIMDSAGQAWAGFVGVICDGMWFLNEVTPHAGGMDYLSLSQATDQLGDSFLSSRTYSTLLTAGRPRDGAASYRPIRFDDPCACWVLDGPAEPAL